MRSKELISTLRKLIKAKLSVLIKGAPGVGKSDLVSQASEAEGCDLIIMHPVVCDPTDFKGMPAVIAGGKRAEFLPFGELEKLMQATKPTVCFIDDLGQASAMVQAAAMQLILARQINGKKISDHVVFIAASNRREDRAGVTGILEPVKSRFATIIELTPHVEDWCEWAIDAKLPSEVIGFVRFRPNHLMDVKAPTSDIVNRPSPRTIHQMAKLFAAGIRDLETITGAVGQGAAAEFIGFVEVCQTLPDIDAILVNPAKEIVPENPAACYAVVSALILKATTANCKNVIKYLARMREEFSVMGVRDLKRKVPDCSKTKEFVDWVVQHQHVML